MANSKLNNKTYSVPQDVKKHIEATLVSNPTGKGVKRAKFIVRNGVLTFQELEGLKHFFKYFNPQTQSRAQYDLAGGDLMRDYVDRTLNSERQAVASGKKIKQDMNANPNSELKPYKSAPRLNESKNELKKNVVAIIVDNDNKILLLKREDNKNIWMPNKWSLVGGAIEKGESPEQACKREIKEETGLDIDDLIDCFTIQRHEDSIESLFAARYDGEPTDIQLNGENTNYGWYDISEIEYLDTVPHLMEYIVLTFKKYE